MLGIPFISLQTIMNAQRQLNPWPSRDKRGLINRKTRSLKDKTIFKKLFFVTEICFLLHYFNVFPESLLTVKEMNWHTLLVWHQRKVEGVSPRGTCQDNGIFLFVSHTRWAVVGPFHIILEERFFKCNNNKNKRICFLDIF